MSLKQGIAIVDRATSWDRISADDKKRVWGCGIEFLSARMQGDMAGVADLLDEAEDNGMERRGHIWIGDKYAGNYPAELKDSARLNMDAAKALGQRLTKMSDDSRLARIELNGESALLRGPVLSGRRWVASGAVGWIDEVIANYEGSAVIDSLLYTSTKQYYLGPEAALKMRDRFNRHCPMIYQSSADAIREKLDKAMALWFDNLNAYVGVGRIDSNGNVIGNDDAWVAAVSYGHWTLTEITHYFGHGSEQMFVEGHDRHRPLIHQVPMLKAAGNGGCC